MLFLVNHRHLISFVWGKTEYSEAPKHTFYIDCIKGEAPFSLPSPASAATAGLLCKARGDFPSFKVGAMSLVKAGHCRKEGAVNTALL